MPVVIKPYSYFEGAVQSLEFHIDDGTRATVGVIARGGDWDFGVANRSEQITVTSGRITGVDQKVYRTGDTLVFKKGEHIRFNTAGPVSYLCRYGK